MRISFVLALFVCIAGCGRTPVSYREQIQPILNTHCVSCHGAENASGKINLTSFEAVMSSRTVHGKKPLVIAGDAAQSWLYILARTNQPHVRMPPDTSSQQPLPDEKIELIGKWIMQGAKNN
jgi:mono/diheme cytochrome c family protein